MPTMSWLYPYPDTNDSGVVQRRRWMNHAACRHADPDAFFPEDGGDVRPAQRICHTCPVIATCAQWALDHNEYHGTWGGLTENDRRKIRLGQSTIERCWDKFKAREAGIDKAAAANRRARKDRPHESAPKPPKPLTPQERVAQMFDAWEQGAAL